MAAALPILLQGHLSVSVLHSYRLVFFGYFVLCLAVAALYLFLSPAVEVASPSGPASPRTKIAPESKKIVAKLTALFSLVFFAVHVLNAASHLGAAWLSRRIGLVNTMVFTHLPSSLFLIAVRFAPSFKIAILLFLCREALVEMDVPTRQSYVAAVVLPTERTFASGLTNLARNVFWAVGSGVAGLVMQNLAFSAPLVIGGGMKITYDFALYRAFRILRPPEERGRTAT